MGHYVAHCPKKKKKQQYGTSMTTEEEDFTSQFVGACVFFNCFLSIDTPSSGWCT
jgi:hypothetical protein